MSKVLGNGKREISLLYFHGVIEMKKGTRKQFSEVERKDSKNLK